MRLTFILPALLLLPACGDNGGETTVSGTTPSSTDPGTGSGTSTSTATGTATTPTTGTSTSEPVTTSTDSATGTGSSTEPATGTVSTTGSTEPGTTDGSSSDTGVMPGGQCLSNKDCALHNDCCDCFGIKAGDPDPICKKTCDQPICDSIGIDQAECRLGVCGTERINCDSSTVQCDAPTPDCPAGQAPGVNQNGTCWTGACVPALSCNVVPDCSFCPADSMCVQKISKQQTLPTCEPVPLECDAKVDCECAGTFVCTGDFNVCNALGGNELSCGCPAC